MLYKNCKNSIDDILMDAILTHLFPMHPLSTPLKHQKTGCFQGVEKGVH